MKRESWSSPAASWEIISAEHPCLMERAPLLTLRARLPGGTSAPKLVPAPGRQQTDVTSALRGNRTGALEKLVLCQKGR
ncbi:hypothetical protein NDU88_004512 [Pleurodeles waltl]|uniref:Uncharacterized protein n=1 Tax=Pleurodeles waltl TaxID=8319 RepID=A0AAV7T7Z8_PLEWA|nr:hypothetical protein NDU88_004512 [Pleurodeles waltl]